MHKDNRTISIIGAGPIGLFCAVFAIRAGFKVEIIAKLSGGQQNCAGLSAGGMLAPTYEFFEEENSDFADFAFSSRKLWGEIAPSLDIEINTSTIALAKDGVADQSPKSLLHFLANRNLKASYQELETAGLKQVGTILESDGLINPRTAHAKLFEYLEQNGVKFRDEEVIFYNNGQIETTSGTVEFDILIIAAGIGALTFSSINPELSNLVPVRGQIVQIDAVSPFSGAVRMGSIYALSRDAQTIIGATTARGENDWSVRASDNRKLLDAPHNLPAGFQIENISAALAGVRPGSIDDKPIVGKSSLENIYLACGAYRNGWLLAPKIGECLIELIKSGENKLPDCFNPSRFGK